MLTSDRNHTRSSIKANGRMERMQNFQFLVPSFPNLLLQSNLLILSGRNGDITEGGGDSMADLWASYHSALGLGSKPPKPPTPLATGHSVSFKVEQRFIYL